MNLLLLLSLLLIGGDQDATFIIKTPTRIDASLLRGSAGAFGASRGPGKTHSGVDIVANQSSQDKTIYAVYAVNSGKIAYARMNGSQTEGYGYTVVIDHKTGMYSQYSHLATEASKSLVKLGDEVAAGQLIGYTADLQNGEKSSGNVRNDVVLPYDKIQLHFECISNKPGIVSTDALSKFHVGGLLVNPTAQLKKLNYNSF